MIIMDSKKSIFQKINEIVNIKEEDKKAVEDAISKIKKIKNDNGRYDIFEAEQAYKSLTKEQAKLVPGDLLNLLSESKDYNDLQNVEEEIKKLENITKQTDPMTKLIQVKRAYNQLPTRLKKRVPEELKKLLNTAEDEYDKFEADLVMKKIENIGTVQDTRDYENTINSVRNAYYSLSEKQRKLVTNLNKLTESEKQYDELKVKNVNTNLAAIEKYNSYHHEKNGLDSYNELSRKQKELVDKNLLNTVKQKYEQMNKQDATNNERNRVSELIKSIENIDFSDPEIYCDIKKASDAYNKLSEEQRERIKDKEIKTLQKAEEIYAGKLTTKIIDQDVSLKKENEKEFIKKYKNARNSYTNSNNSIKKYIPTDALKLLEENKTQYDILVAKDVESRINEVGPVGRSDSFEAILSQIQNDYDKLDKTQKQLISEKTMKLFEDIKTQYDNLVASDIKSYMEKIKNVEITDSFGKMLSEANRYFDAITEARLMSKETLQLLNDAKNKLEVTDKNYKNHKEAENVMKMINSINSPVTRTEISEIENAETAYCDYIAKLELYNWTDNFISLDCQKKLNGAKKAIESIEDVDNVKCKIDSIDKTIDITSGDQIYSARKAYEKLNEIQKKEVDNYKKLTDAEKSYIPFAIENAKEKIKSIGNVSLTPEFKIKILDARQAFDKIPTDRQKEVSNLKTLVDSENKYNELATESVVDAINKIKEVELSGTFKSQIDEAYDAFKSLSPEMQKKVKNFDILEKAVTDLEQKEKTYKNALAEIKTPLKNIDKFHKDHSSTFNASFDDQLKKGFDLCIKTDEGLKNYENKNLIDNLDKDRIKILKKLIEEQPLHTITINYLYFMIDQIKAKKYYSEFNNNKQPQIINDNDFDIDRKNIISEQDVENAMNKFKGSESNDLKSLFMKVKRIPNMLKFNGPLIFSSLFRNNYDIKILSLLRKLLVAGQLQVCENEKWETMTSRQQFQELTKIEKELPSKNGDKELELVVKNILQYMEKIVGSVMVWEKPTTPLWNVDKNLENPCITEDDVHQGMTNTCWLLSTLLSVIKSDPKLILNCFPKYKDEIDLKTGLIKGETITVRLWRVLLSGHEKNAGLRLYARTFGKYVDIKMNATITNKDYGNKAKVCWPRFLEKAMSVARTIKNLVIVDDSSGKNFLLDEILDYSKKEWNKLDLHWDSSDWDYGAGIAQAMITGHTSGFLADVNVNSKFSNYHDIQESYFEYIKKHLEKKHKITTICKESFKLADSDLIVMGQHAYSLIDAYVENGQQKIKILNPYNDKSLSSKGFEGQSVVITIQKFIKYFLGINIGGVSKL